MPPVHYPERITESVEDLIRLEHEGRGTPGEPRVDADVEAIGGVMESRISPVAHYR